MSASLRHISASLLLALYLPIALALPFFHIHSDEAEFGGVISYSAPHEHEAGHSHADDCPACKFASSHWNPPQIAECTIVENSLPPAVSLRQAPPAPTHQGLFPPRGPPSLS